VHGVQHKRLTAYCHIATWVKAVFNLGGSSYCSRHAAHNIYLSNFPTWLQYSLPHHSMSDSILSCLCCCIVLPWSAHLRHEREIGQGDRRPRTGIPRDLRLRHRQRGLSVSSSGELKKSQCQSQLLNDLPSEIRNIIWLICLGGRKLHLVIRDRRLQHVECTSAGSEVCRKPAAFASSGPDHDNISSVRNYISLLVSCRQV
jgi:hypothetical protein